MVLHCLQSTPAYAGIIRLHTQSRFCAEAVVGANLKLNWAVATQDAEGFCGNMSRSIVEIPLQQVPCNASSSTKRKRVLLSDLGFDIRRSSAEAPWRAQVVAHTTLLKGLCEAGRVHEAQQALYALYIAMLLGFFGNSNFGRVVLSGA